MLDSCHDANKNYDVLGLVMIKKKTHITCETYVVTQTKIITIKSHK
jgi:hypothetical protein